MFFLQTNDPTLTFPLQGREIAFSPYKGEIERGSQKHNIYFFEMALSHTIGRVMKF